MWVNEKVHCVVGMGNGIGTLCAIMRIYRCSCDGEWNWYRVWSNEKVQAYLIWGIGLLQSVE